MKPANRKFKSSIIIFFAIDLFLLGCWWFVFMFLQKQYAALEEGRSNLYAMTMRDEQAKMFEKKIEEFREKDKMVSDVFVNEKELIKFIKSLEDLALKTNASLKIESVDIPQGNTPVFQLKVAGEFTQVYHYLILLENIPYEIVFDEARLQAVANQTAKSKKIVWEGHFKIRLLSYLSS